MDRALADIRLDEAEPDRRADAVAAACLALGATALTALLALVLFAAPRIALPGREILVIAAIALSGAAALAAAAGRRPGERAPWLLLGLGAFAFAAGFVLLYFVAGSRGSFPTAADICWLLFYPLFAAAIGMLVRGHGQPFRRLGITLDAAIVALASAGLGYAVIFNGLINAGQASNLLGGQLSYSVLDLAMLVMLVLICSQSGTGIGRGYLALGAGMTIFLVSDTVLVKQLIDGAYQPGTVLDAGWPAGLLCMAAASRLGTSLRRLSALRGRDLYVSMTTSLAVALTLLITDALGDQDVIVMVLAALVPCLILVRLVLAVHENDRLARDNEDIITSTGAGILRVDRRGSIVAVNPAAAAMLGWRQEELVGLDAHSTTHHSRADGAAYPSIDCPATGAIEGGEVQRVIGEVFWRKDGTSFPVDYTSSPIRDGGKVVGAVLVFDDVSRQRRLEASLRHQAEHDHLTGLHNRRVLLDQTSALLLEGVRDRRPGALAIIDLDAFKFVNDSFGHPIGDDLLRQVAAILKRGFRGSDVVARLGGDEFAVLMRDIKPADAMAAAEGVLAEIKRLSSPRVVATAGLAIFDGSTRLSGDDLLIHADLALYEAKQHGGDRAARFAGRKSPALTWVERIREAIADDRFVVYAQPIVDLRSGAVVREEMLVRMRDEHGEIVSPSSFLPTAERFGLIGEIDRLMVDRGLDLAGKGRAVSVNLSARSLADLGITGQVGAAVSAGLDPGLISFEITETSVAANMHAAAEFAARLERLGCTLALDDFGTGFGSFTYLRHLPVQEIKVDIDFVRGLPHNLSDYHLVRVLASLARSLGQKLIAEGIEDPRAIEVLRRLGVDYGQGYFLGKPRPVDGGQPLEPEAKARAVIATPLHA